MFHFVLSSWILDGGPMTWISSFNPSFPSTIGHIHKTFFAGTWVSSIKLQILGFIYSFPLNSHTQDCSWLKNNILCLKFVSLIFRYSKKQNNRPESPYSFPRKFFALQLWAKL